MVEYYKTPARVVYELEIDSAFCAFGSRCAAERGFSGVDFVTADVRVADLRFGTVFYLFSPFRGSILRTVLDRLRTLSRERSIRILSYGPCSTEIAKEGWLRETDPARVVTGEVGTGEYVLRVFETVVLVGWEASF